MSFVDHYINLPVAQPLTRINVSRALLNAHSVGELSPSVTAAVALTLFPLTAQMHMQIAIVALILVDILIYLIRLISTTRVLLSHPDICSGLQSGQILDATIVQVSGVMRDKPLLFLLVALSCACCNR
jgi:hypothetical protein